MPPPGGNFELGAPVSRRMWVAAVIINMIMTVTVAPRRPDGSVLDTQVWEPKSRNPTGY